MSLIALDADGVLLNYHEAYRLAWERAFGVLPSLKDRHAYWPIDRWNVEQLSGDKLIHFRNQFDEQFWSSIPPNEGAVDACKQLQAGGFELVCVSAMEERFLKYRVKNLRDCGFAIEHVYPTGSTADNISPKADVLAALAPAAFVDDYLPYMRGLSAGIYKALILREPNGSPNFGDELATVNSTHHSLAEFASWWLARS